jgi:hypothetical protein
MDAKTTVAIRRTGLPFTALIALSAACSDGPAGPATAGAPQHPSHSALLVPAVQSARLSVRRQLTEIKDGTSNTILLGAVLVEWVRFADGTMDGVLQIWLDTDGPPETFLAVEGEVECSGPGQDLNRDHSLLRQPELFRFKDEPLMLTVERVGPAGGDADEDRLRHTLDYADGSVLSFDTTGEMWHADNVCGSGTAGS